ncbi:hypothetical protein F5141DRAFT_1066739 [Pisolithus sp. B1]|nr:hypothetical protein F5141DRAFT_1066739 [Pisolithus sp. B1]
MFGWMPAAGLASTLFMTSQNLLPTFDVDVDTPLPPLPKDVTLLGKFPTLRSMVEHAIGCLLVAEHSHFLMQHGHHVWKEVLSMAVEEYKTSNTQLAVSAAVKAVFCDYNGDMDGLCEAIKLLIKPGADSV